MTTWTAAAKAELEQYFRQVRPALQASGADPEEVIEDLRRHLDAEIATAQLSVVTEADVRRLLGRIGAPAVDLAVAVPPTDQTGAPTPASPARLGCLAAGCIWFAGVLLPLVTLGIEMITGMCAGAFFDPIPTLAHAALVALVPLANGWGWWSLSRGDARHLAWLGGLNAAALAVGTVYAMVFVPLLLPGFFALLFFGWGLLPWSPLLSLIATLFMRVRLRRLNPSGGRLPGLGLGLALGFAALVLAEAPVTLTRLGSHWAASEVAATQRAGVRLLRAVGREEQMLRDCYGFTPGAANMDLLGQLVTGGERVPAERARETFYRVTGEAFNARPAPVVRTGRGIFRDLNNWTWDADHGGDQVGGRIRGLSLISSRLDAVVNAPAAWSYAEWTLQFRNDSDQPREARAQILLPPGGVVSRLTLWVNGEEREAAFAGRSHVREAYREVAVIQRRDPVLVTTAGPDRVLMQCFPVPAGGGTMKVRLGITAPLALARADEGGARLPQLLERNFSMAEGFTHTVWLEGAAMTCALPQLAGTNGLQGRLSNAELASSGATVRVPRDPAARHAWTRDLHAEGPRFIRQTLRETPATAPSGLIVVVDGSRAMRAHLGEVAAILGTWAANKPLTVLVAADEVVTLGQRAARSPDADALERLAAWSAAGGQDNVPALREALELAGRQPGAVVLWLHAPVPVALSSPEPLVQALQRNPHGTRLLSFQFGNGPDRILEQLDGLSKVAVVPRLGEAGADLKALLDGWREGARTLRLDREVAADEAAARADGAVEGTQHLARLWARDEVRRLTAARKTGDAVAEASRQQLVTPVSGAVVLESQAQFDRAGLTPVDAQTVPAIPEPSTAALLLLGGALLLAARRRPAKTFAAQGSAGHTPCRIPESRP